MPGETDISVLLKSLKPILNDGSYVFVCLQALDKKLREHILFEFKEKEGITIVLRKEKADELNLDYEFVASWITLNVHSALEAVGLTAAVSTALTKYNISCNVVAAYYHDHIFVPIKDTTKAMAILGEFSGK
ncbi:hypothetical protein CLV90_0358 [Maribacter spongiicola]|uniref:DUF2241 domain-containing protein n=1 Tax=Maribacter spongiicola TaxID=1206753 RepID=A0A4R7K5M9_9FLAO|nr:ACT domain-containing protein [Maribacter spongiicola]TDT46310.1 hypothetical protein CLV90_0358 [Maribacter spongiicola]